MRVIRCGVMVIAAAWALHTAAWAAPLQVYGNTRGPGKETGWYEVWTYLQRKGDVGMSGVQSSDRDGNWMHGAHEGEYVFGIVDAFGRGPFIRPGVFLSEDRFNRVDMIMHFTYGVGGNKPSGKHKETGQTFVSIGRDIIVVDAHVPAGAILTLKEGGPEGKQIASLPHRMRFASGELPVEPGRVYYIGWTMPDGKPFEVERTDPENPYQQGTAFYDGKAQPDVDLGMQITVMPPGQFLTNFPRGAQLYKWADDGYGQTFTANGTSLAMIGFSVAYGDKRWADPTVRILRGGPGGRQVGPTRRSRPCLYAPGEVPLAAGEVYYIEITEPGDPPGLNAWVEAGGDVYPGGHLYVNGQPEPDRDWAFTLAEYVPDHVPPPPVSRVRNFPGDGVMKIVFDVPESMDISRVIVRRTTKGGAKSPNEGDPVADLPVSAAGRHWLLDKGLQPYTGYVYTFFTIDAAGNFSDPVSGSGRTVPRATLPAEIINGDFTAPRDGLLPRGWCVYSMYAAPAFAGWESPDGKTKAAGWSTIMVEHDIVFYQRVPVTQGRRYLLSANTYRREPWANGNANQLTLVGIDPAGATDPLAPGVVWSPQEYVTGEWRQQRIVATADSDVITVYLRGWAQYGGGNMTPFFANVELQDVTGLCDE